MKYKNWTHFVLHTLHHHCSKLEPNEGLLRELKIDFEIDLLEEQVYRALEDERAINEIILKKKLSMDEFEKKSTCQGVTDNLDRRLWAVFQCKRVCYWIGKKKVRHVVLYAKGVEEYIVDGTIRQFLPTEKKKVFKLKDYPLEPKGVQTWNRMNTTLQIAPKGDGKNGF